MLGTTLKRTGVTLLAIVVGALVLSPALWAQRSTGTITGMVKDTTGAVIPQAAVTATNMDTNVKRTFVTDSSGSFTFSSMSPGRYRVSAEKQGFKTMVVSGVTLGLDENRRVDLTLPVGPVKEEVKVNANALHVDTDTPDISSTIAGQEIRNLPIMSRNYMEALGWRAGVTPGFASSTDWIQSWVSPGNSGAMSSNSTVTNYNVGGGRVSQNSFGIDGLTNTNTAYGNSSVTPSMDAIQEVKIETSYYSAESKGTSMINVVTKSGTNNWHGTAFESYKGDVLQPTDPRTGNPDTGKQPYKPPYSFHQFGGSFGGPIRLPGYDGRDRTFFFVSYEGTRFRSTSSNEVYGIDPAWWTGDFSNYKDDAGNLILIYDPATNPRTPFPGNKIPADRIAPQAAKYLDMFVPSGGTGGLQMMYLTNSYDIGNLMARVDHNFSDHDKLSGRFNLQTTDNHEAAYTRYSDGLLDLPSKNVALVYTHIFSPRLVNEFRLGYARSIIGMQLDSSGGSHNYGQEIGFANTATDPMAWGVPRIFFRGSLPNLGPSLSVEADLTNTYQVYDMVSWSHGRQNWKFGVDIRHDLDRVNKSSGWGVGGLRFWNGYTAASPTATIETGHYFADFLLGLASYARIAIPYRNYPQSWQLAFFAQNDWAVTPNLTLNLGLRYEYSGWPTDKNGPGGMELDLSQPGGAILTPNQAFVDTVKSPIFSVGSRSGVMKPDRNDFAPRVGLAWRPFKSDDFVVRAGYGIFYVKADDWYEWERIRVPDLETAPNPISRNRRQAGIDIRTMFLPSTVTGTSLPYWASTAMVADARHPYSQQWSLGVQKMITNNLLLNTTYQGRTGTKLPHYLLFNQAPPTPDGNPQALAPYQNFTPYSSIVCFCTTSNYNALQVQLERRMSKGLAFTAAYTWSKSIDTGSEVQAEGDTSNVPNQSHNLKAEKGVSDFDVPHRLVLTYMYQLPFGRGRTWMTNAPGWVEAILGGWETDGVLTFMSGRAWTPKIGWDNSNTGLGSYGDAERAMITGDPTPSGFQPGLLGLVDPAAFPNPDTYFGTFGNVKRNSFRGIGTRQWDMTVLKNFKLNERMNLEIRGSLFNVTHRFGNGAVPSTYDTYVWTPDFGKIVYDKDHIWAAADKQLSIRFSF